jgi:hypothetical protein
MTRMTRLALSLCLATMFASQANAATVGFTGTTGAGSLGAFAAGTPVTLTLTYTPVGLGGGLTAVVTAASLNIQGFTPWNSLTGVNTISIVPNGAGNDNLSVSLNFNPAGGLGTTVATLSMTFSGDEDLGLNPDATEANVGAILFTASGGNPASGNFTFIGGGIPGFGIAPLSGAAVVPEPGSMMLLSGLGLVLGRRAWKRRRAVEPATTA